MSANDGLSDDGLSDDGLSDDGLSDDGLSDDGLSDDGLSDDGMLVQAPDARGAERDETDDEITATIRGTLGGAATRLEAAEARDEALAVYMVPKRRMLIERRPVMQPLGRVWRLGVLLLEANGSVYATGSTVRALEPPRIGFASRSAEERSEYAAAAARGDFARGDTVNFDATELAVDAASLRGATGPLFLRGDAAFVRWNGSDAAAVELETYLDDRVGLLVDPPAGA